MYIEVQRMSGKGSKITIINPDHYTEFFQELKGRADIELWLKAFLAIAVSGGCRVSEALELKVCDIDTQGQYMVRALKKRSKSEVYRPCIMCPLALELVQDYISKFSLDSQAKLFNKHRSTIHRKIKKHFGCLASSHSLARHSHISWLLHKLNLSTTKVAAEMKMLSHVIDLYSHSNIELEQLKRFSNFI